MKKKLFVLVMAAAMMSTAAIPAMAEEAAVTNVNDPNYEWPDYSG